jgi:hypothetical protein
MPNFIKVDITNAIRVDNINSIELKSDIIIIITQTFSPNTYCIKFESSHIAKQMFDYFLTGKSSDWNKLFTEAFVEMKILQI